MEEALDQDLFAELTLHLESFDDVKLRSIVDKEENVTKLVEIAWDLVPKVCSYLTEENNDKDEFIKACEHILIKLSEIGNVKEILLVLLEQLDCGISDVRLVVLLVPVQKCLMSLPSKRGHSLAITLETLYGCLNQFPELHQQEDEERKLLDMDPDVRRIIHIINEVLLFLQPFAFDSSSSSTQKREITTFLIKILDHPLGQLDLSHSNSANKDTLYKSRSRDTADRLMTLISKTEKDFSAAIRDISLENERIYFQRKNTHAKEKLSGEEEVDDLMLKEPIPELGLAVFVYLFISNLDTYQENKPQVFTIIHWLDSFSDLIAVLLQHSNILIRDKGIGLVNELVTMHGVILSDYYPWENCKALLDSIVVVMCSSQSKQLAQNALKAYSQLYKKCESERRFKILCYIMLKSNHSGLLGYTITLLKDEIDSSLNGSLPDISNFQAPKVVKLLKMVFILPDQEKTDLLDNMDRIMSALNLIRYLAVRDKPAFNTSGFWSVYPWIEKEFLQALRIDLNMSRSHYNLEIEQIKSGKKPDAVDFSVSGQAMPGMSKEQKLQVMEMAMFRFDMVESILVRVEELIQQAQKN